MFYFRIIYLGLKIDNNRWYFRDFGLWWAGCQTHIQTQREKERKRKIYARNKNRIASDRNSEERFFYGTIYSMLHINTGTTSTRTLFHLILTEQKNHNLFALHKIRWGSNAKRQEKNEQQIKMPENIAKIYNQQQRQRRSFGMKLWTISMFNGSQQPACDVYFLPLNFNKCSLTNAKREICSTLFMEQKKKTYHRIFFHPLSLNSCF